MPRGMMAGMPAEEIHYHVTVHRVVPPQWVGIVIVVAVIVGLIALFLILRRR